VARKKYTSEFREQAVRLVTIENMKHAKVAADLGISPHTLVSWVSQARALRARLHPRLCGISTPACARLKPSCVK